MATWEAFIVSVTAVLFTSCSLTPGQFLYNFLAYILILTVDLNPMRLTYNIILFLCLFVLPAHLQATTYTSMSDQALLDQSAIVISGNVITVEQDRTPHKPQTLYTVFVTEILKGTIHDNEIVIAVPGGPTQDGMYYKVEGAPRFSMNQDVLLFLEHIENNQYSITQFMLGSFMINEREGVSFAERDLAEAAEIPNNRKIQQDSEGNRARDSKLFQQWIRDSREGVVSPYSYWISKPPSGTFGISKYVTAGARWQDFDQGSGVEWMAHTSGQANMPGGGFVEFQAALTAWTNDLNSNIEYTYGGTTSDINHINTILFNDPTNQISGSYDCYAGGTLAIGIWWSQNTHSYNGTNYNSIVKGSIVTQDGAGCFFSGNSGKNGEEVFAHELGHTLGINHATDSDALMFEIAHGDGRGAELKLDDRNAASFLYEYIPEPPATPNAPLVSVNDATGEITVDWFDVATATSYKLLRSTTTAGTGNEIYAGSALQYVDNSTNAGTKYYYRIKACNADGCSGHSGYTEGQITHGSETSDGSLIHIYELLLLN